MSLNLLCYKSGEHSKQAAFSLDNERSLNWNILKVLEYKKQIHFLSSPFFKLYQEMMDTAKIVKS